MSKLTQIEHNFILLLRAALANRIVKSEDFPPATDTSAILRLAANHKLYHMILSTLPEESLPANVQRRTELIRQMTTQVQLSSAFLDLYKNMEQAGFHPLVVKGIVCRSLYPQPEFRPSSDEDLYIPAAEFESCCAFLQTNGFSPNKTPFADYKEIGWRSENGLYIELHRDLFEGNAFVSLQEFFRFDSVNTEAYMTHHGVSVVSLSPHEHFLYLLLHAYKHFVHSGFGIRQICDIGMWVKEYSEKIHWQKLAEQCDLCGIRSFVKATLGIAKHMLNISFALPAEWESSEEYCLPMCKDILSGGIYGSSNINRVHSGTLTLHAIQSSETTHKGSVLHSLFPSRDLLENKYTYLKKHPILLPVAWCSRILSYAKRHSAGETNASKSLEIGKERLDLLRFYDILH